MPITVKCPSCQKAFRAPDAAAGRTVKCPACTKPLTVTAAESSGEVSSTTGRQTSAVRVASSSGLKKAVAPATGSESPASAPKAPRTRPSTTASSPGPVKAVAVADHWYVQSESGEQYGPISRRELDTWVAESRVTSASQVLQNGWDQWKWAGELYPELSEGGVTAAEDNPFAALAATDSSVNQFAAPQHTSTPSATAGDGKAIAWHTVRTGLSIAYNALVVGGIGFSAISLGLMYIILVASGGPSGGGGSAYFMIVMMIWGIVAVFASSVSLLTGWCVCLQVPRRSQATTPIQGAIGAIGIAILLAVVATLIPLGMMGATDLESMRTVRQMMEFLPWLIQMVVIAAFAMYGFFLGTVGRYFNHRTLPQMAMFYAIFQGANALWATLSKFVLPTSSTMAKVEVFIFVATGLVGYGWLIYLTGLVRQVVRRHLARA